MLKFLPLVALALMIPAGSLSAADLANRSGVGAVFAEPTAVARGARVSEQVVLVETSSVRNSPQVAGYYGRAGDFHYRNYYGTPRPLIGQILPYACILDVLC